MKKSESRFLILIVQKSLQIALKFFWYATTCPGEKLACCLYALIRVMKTISSQLVQIIIYDAFLFSRLISLIFFVASFFLAHISVIYVWWPNQKRYFVTRIFLIATEVILSLRQRNQTFYMSKGKIGTHKFWFPFSLAFTMRCFKSSKICWIEINIAKLIKYW